MSCIDKGIYSSEEVTLNFLYERTVIQLHWPLHQQSPKFRIDVKQLALLQVVIAHSSGYKKEE